MWQYVTYSMTINALRDYLQQFNADDLCNELVLIISFDRQLNIFPFCIILYLFSLLICFSFALKIAICKFKLLTSGRSLSQKIKIPSIQKQKYYPTGNGRFNGI